MLTGNVYPEICISLLTVFALTHCNSFSEASSRVKTTPPTTSRGVTIECTPGRCALGSTDLFECADNQYNNDQDCTSNSTDQNWSVKCMRPSQHTCEVMCQKCDLESNKETIYCGNDIHTSRDKLDFTCTKMRQENTTTASSPSKVSRVGKVKATSSSSALSSAARTISPTSSSSVASRVATLMTTSSSLALLSAAEKLDPTSSSLILSSIQKLSSASSSQIVSSGTASAPTTSSSIVSLAPTLSLSKKSQKLANDTISKFNGLDITNINSLQAAANLLQKFTTEHQTMTPGEGQPGVEKPRTESIFKVAVAFQKTVLSYGKYHLSGTKRSKRISYPHPNIFLAIQKDYKQSASDLYLDNHEWQASINISSANFADNGSVIIAYVYKDLDNLLQPHSDKTRRIITRIIMVAMDPNPGKLQENVILKFKNLKIDTREKHCVFWRGLSSSPTGTRSLGKKYGPTSQQPKQKSDR